MNNELLATVTSYGLEFSDANDMNIPVNIFLEQKNDGWTLSADNFMPRKSLIENGSFSASAPTKEALVEIVRVYILPLYQNAMNKLNGIINGTRDNLYYWDNEK